MSDVIKMAPLLPLIPNVPRVCVYPLRPPPETHPLFMAVLSNDLEKLKYLLNADESVNSRNSRGQTLLGFIILHKRVEMFDYLLSLDDLEIDLFYNFGQSPLLLATCPANEYFVTQLIKKKANIHQRDWYGNTALHIAATNRSCLMEATQVSQLIIEEGGDVSSQNNSGRTPLYEACDAGNVDLIFLLLYHGALATVPSNEGILPIVIISTKIPLEDRLELEGILFDLTFDDIAHTISLSTLCRAMLLDSPLFSKIVEIISDIDYDVDDLKLLSSILIDLNPKHFQLFLCKFSHILRETVDDFPVFSKAIELFSHKATRKGLEILYICFGNNEVTDFIQRDLPSAPIIHNLVCSKFERQFVFDLDVIKNEEIYEIVYVLLSYGLTITSFDLNTVYKYYGFCEFFKILLHMDIHIVSPIEPGDLMASLYYNPKTPVEDFFKMSPSICVKFFSYYNHFKLKEKYLKESVSNEIAAKIRTLPHVPSLLELSRNAARQFIVIRYHIKNSMQFYTILKSLPIDNFSKRVIALEEMLY